MRVEIWSDISCPWCYLGQARFEKALADFAQHGDVEVVHRSFELDSSLQKGAAAPIVDVLVRKAGMSRQQALANEENLRRKTAEEGLDYVLGRDHGRTFDMHRALQLAKVRGRQHELLKILYRANFAEQRSIFDDDERLIELCVEAGLDAAEVREVLSSPDAFVAEVRADEKEASAIGAHAVPFFLFDGKFGLAGAQPVDSFRQALERAWGERTIVQLAEDADAEACGPHGCPVPHAAR